MRMFELAKRAGEDAAEERFGLTHGTPKPPAPWSQKWQDDKVKNVSKKVTIPSMQQVALKRG